MPPEGWPDRLVLHLGAHKTASTHFQRGLRRGRGRLERADARLYTPPDLRKGADLADWFGVSFQTGLRRATWTPELLARMAGGAGRLVVSEENLLGQMTGASDCGEPSLYPQAGLRLSAVSAGTDPLPISLFIAIRDPASYLVSAYGQSLFGGYGQDFGTFVARCPLEGVDWCDLAERLLAVPRVSELVVWRQEDYPAVAPAAANALAGADVARQGWFDHAPMHRGLSARAVAEALKAPRGPERIRAAGAARRQFPVTEEEPAFRPFDAEALAVSREFYDEQWATLAEMAGVRRLLPPVSGGG
ncbi:hypothetical protein [Histidinibacterium aquaticum]|uniref:Sulfotransferase family protein n=1 Tax=Histidinibacterium aquaticum TaxID=2613962 RepID=A0A5J5GBC5_9RHOB|nr:hypothetical protein [Histidinibacterium aquaticum]KAA9004784.1 hypothetical protein F3S47_19200 [Histidinibacterium aquaticum]